MDNRETAVHEAGHAVVAERLGRRVIELRYEHPLFGDSFTSTEEVPLDSPSRRDEEAMVALAGIAAVSLFLQLPKNLDNPDDDEEDNDVAVARRHAAGSAEDESDVETHLWSLWARTLTLMWQEPVVAEVAAVVRPLLARHRETGKPVVLSGDEVRGLIDSAHV